MTIRLGIIGCGDMGESHRSAFAELGDRVRVTATADVDLDRARAAADHFGAELATTDYRDTLDAVDAVLVVTPHDLHAEMGLTALRAGKHVLMEKPMAVSEQECLDLIAESSDRDLVLMTAYPMRFHPLVRTLKNLVDQRLLGDHFHAIAEVIDAKCLLRQIAKDAAMTLRRPRRMQRPFNFDILNR